MDEAGGKPLGREIGYVGQLLRAGTADQAIQVIVLCVEIRRAVRAEEIHALGIRIRFEGNASNTIIRTGAHDQGLIRIVTTEGDLGAALPTELIEIGDRRLPDRRGDLRRIDGIRESGTA